MPADYPDAIFAPRTIENRPGVTYDPDDTKTLYAEDLQALGNEIVAIETELGTNPKGSDDDVSARLDRMEDDTANVASSLASGKVGGTYQNYSASNLTTSSTSPVQVGSAQVTVTTKGGKLLVIGTARMRTNTNTAHLVVQVDGSNVADVLTNATVNTRMIAIGVSGALAAGNHTIKLMWYVQSGATATIDSYDGFSVSAVEL